MAAGRIKQELHRSGRKSGFKDVDLEGPADVVKAKMHASSVNGANAPRIRTETCRVSLRPQRLRGLLLQNRAGRKLTSGLMALCSDVACCRGSFR